MAAPRPREGARERVREQSNFCRRSPHGRAKKEPLRTITRRRPSNSKPSLEFSKLVNTNLHLINAGALLATPTIANFLKFNDAPASDKIFLIGTPSGLFLLAMCCAYRTCLSFRYHAHYEYAELQKKLDTADEVYRPTDDESRDKTCKDAITEALGLMTRVHRRIIVALFLADCSGRSQLRRLSALAYSWPIAFARNPLFTLLCHTHGRTYSRGILSASFF